MSQDPSQDQAHPMSQEPSQDQPDQEQLEQPQDLSEIVANIPLQDDPADEALTRLFQGVVNQMNGLRNIIGEQQADISGQQTQITNLEQDAVQREEYQKNLENQTTDLRSQLDILSAEMDMSDCNTQSVKDLHEANQRLRELKEKAEAEAVATKKQNSDLLDMVWDLYSGYNGIINNIMDHATENQNNNALKSMSDKAQKENEEIVQNMIGNINKWDKKNTDCAVSMALIFNQEKRRIFLKRKFSRIGTTRRQLF